MSIAFQNKKIADVYFENRRVAKAYFQNQLFYQRVVHQGLTYVTSGSVNAQIDLLPKTDKHGYFSITQLDGSFAATINDGTGRTWSAMHYPNCVDIYAPGAGTYVLEVQNFDEFSSAGIEFFNDPMPNVIGILTFDGYDKTTLSCTNNNTFAGVTSLPSLAKNYIHFANITTIDGLFKNAHLTCEIIPVIEAMMEAAPNLIITDGVFTYDNCLDAPDIDDAFDLYPEWFITAPAGINKFRVTFTTSGNWCCAEMGLVINGTSVYNTSSSDLRFTANLSESDIFVVWGERLTVARLFDGSTRGWHGTQQMEGCSGNHAVFETADAIDPNSIDGICLYQDISWATGITRLLLEGWDGSQWITIKTLNVNLSASTGWKQAT